MHSLMILKNSLSLSLSHTLTPSLHTYTTSASPASHPTLSTSVSVIGSMWTPIATPSVVSQHQPPRQLVPSTSTKPTLPSPLITSHSSLSLNSKGEEREKSEGLVGRKGE